jgi:hypothetical protein
MNHLAPDELVRLAETGGAAAHPHLDECARCRDEVRGLGAMLGRVRADELPEPSPLFWDRFTAQVADRVRTESTGVRVVSRRWLSWRVLVPIAAGAAAIILAVVLTGRAPERPRPPVAAAVDAPLAADDAGFADDEQWQMLTHLAGDFDVETVSDSIGAAGRTGVERAVWELSDRERAELGRLLLEELRSAPSGS